MKMRRTSSSSQTLLPIFFITVVVVIGAPIVAQARITRIEMTRVESPTFQGASFGTVGQYEKLVGRAFGEIDPTDPRNALITDIQLAPRNAGGMVEYSTDIYILRPIDRSKGNHRLFFDINNRGDNRSFFQFNDATTGGNDPTTAADAGNGFLMRQGYTMLWSGWEPTVAPGAGRFTMTVPIAKNPDGSAIVGSALEELVIDNSTTLTGTLTYPRATLDKSQASLTVRVRYQDAPTPVPAAGWEYVNDQNIRLLPAGTAFQQGTLYELTYPARDPIVAGLGFPAIRDVAAFLHHAVKDDRGNLNPLAGDVQFVYSFCVSQPCRTMHDWGRRIASSFQRRMPMGMTSPAFGFRMSPSRWRRTLGGGCVLPLPEGTMGVTRSARGSTFQRQRQTDWWPAIRGCRLRSGSRTTIRM